MGVLEQIREAQKRQEAAIERLNRAITGDMEAHEGLMFKVAQLEEQAEARKFWTQTLGAGVIGAFILSLWSLITTGKSHQ
jgi:uncharacterized membrane protein YjjP (DUF1212 family)